MSEINPSRRNIFPGTGYEAGRELHVSYLKTEGGWPVGKIQGGSYKECLTTLANMATEDQAQAILMQIGRRV